MNARVTTQVIDGEGVRLAVCARGRHDHPTVVLVHGWPDTRALWDPIATLLAETHHVVAYDVRGAGASDHPADREAYCIEVLVADLAAVIDVVSPDRPVHLVGHDWGSVQGWEAVSDPRLRGRLSSFTSISGPSLDHSGHAIRAMARGRLRDRLRLIDQVLRFTYVLSFATPVPRAVRWRGPDSRLNRITRAAMRRALTVVENHPPSADHPAPSVAFDAAHGTNMYLANIVPRLRNPQDRRTDVPVQIIEATNDPVVRKAALDASEPWVSSLRRRSLPGGHWMVRSHAREIAEFVAEFVAAHEHSTDAQPAMTGGRPDAVDNG